MKGRVFVVDDDPKMGKLLQFKLSKEGFVTEYFSGAKEALAMVAHIKPRLIISDIEMPEMNGHEFCDRLRHNARTASIPFIFLSSRSEATDQLEGLRLGADDYVCKPLKMDYLLERIGKVLERAAKARVYKSQADFGGNLKEMNLNDVLQIVESNQKTGELVFSSLDGTPIGKMFFNRGNLANATLGRLIGVEAFFGLMDVQEGRADFYGKTVSYPQRISTPNVAVLLQGSRLIDEGKNLYQVLPDLDVRLEIWPGEIPDALIAKRGAEALQRLYALIEDQMTVRQMINTGEMSRPRTAAMLAELLQAQRVGVPGGERPSAPEPTARGGGTGAPWLIKLLESIEDRKMTGVLGIIGRGTPQTVYFVDGKMVHAQYGSDEGENAFFRILAEGQGAPKLELHPISVQATISKPLDALIAEAQSGTG